MVRSRWIGPVFGVAAMTGLALGQTKSLPVAAPAADAPAQTITVREAGKPAQKCKVLKTWTEVDGSRVSQVQALDTGEMMTIEAAPTADGSPLARPMKGAMMHVYRWGRGRQSPPPGTPLAPGDDIIVSTTVISTTIDGRPASPAALGPAIGHDASPYARNQDAGCACAPSVVTKVEPTPDVMAPTRVVQEPVIVLPPPPQGDPALAPAKTPLFGRWGLMIGQNKASAGPDAPAATAKAPAAGADKKAPSATAKAEISPAPPGDWRQSWGKVDAPKSPAAPSADPPAAVTVKPKVVTLPQAEVRADDPLKDPEKYTSMPRTVDAVGPKNASADDKAGNLRVIASKQPTAATADKKTDGPATTSPAVGADKAPVAPGMKSVLAASSPELTAPPPAAKGPPASGGRPQIDSAMGVDPNEPNAFSEGTPAPNISRAPNAFSAPRQAPAAADPRTAALAINAFAAPPQSPAPGAETHGFPDSTLPTRPPATPATAYTYPPQPAPVTTAGYHTNGGPDLTAVFGILRESMYPSRREDAAERLGAMDWHLQPQILDILVEKARQDPAPGVRAECLRSLGRLKANTLPAVEAVKAMQTDSDPRVRQEADDAYAAITGTTPKAANLEDASPIH